MWPGKEMELPGPTTRYVGSSANFFGRSHQRWATLGRVLHPPSTSVRCYFPTTWGQALVTETSVAGAR